MPHAEPGSHADDAGEDHREPDSTNPNGSHLEDIGVDDTDSDDTVPALFQIPPGVRQVPRRVVLLTGPSGSGKSSLVRRLGVPAVQLDDFYHDIDHPGLPQRFGTVDWDSPRTWNATAAVSALEDLCRHGEAELPLYDIPTSRRTGTRQMVTPDAPLILAEGIFAAELIADLRRLDLLADALCLVRPRIQTFWLRLLRDIAESRKPLPTLLRRGLAHTRAEPALIRSWVAQGARKVSVQQAERRITKLAMQSRP